MHSHKISSRHEISFNIILSNLQLSNEDNGSFSEFSNPHTPPMMRGATDEVKQELKKAIRCRRVAQGLEEMPNLEARRPSSNQVEYVEFFSFSSLIS